MEKYYFNSVCIIDDNPIDVLILSKLIELTKFSKITHSFYDPIKALNWIKSLSEAPYDLPEIFFVDISMPFISGFELIEKMEKDLPSKLCRKLQFAIVTSSSEPNDRIRAAAHKNVLSYLIKPIKPEDLKPEQFLKLKDDYFRQKNLFF